MVSCSSGGARRSWRRRCAGSCGSAACSSRCGGIFHPPVPSKRTCRTNSKSTVEWASAWRLMSDALAVVVIVLTYNHWTETRAGLASVFGSAGGGVRVLVIDNGSTDETVDALGVEFPQVDLVRNEANLGYAEGNNVGLRRAILTRADYAL